ncbi:MAG: peptidylprolyl isomerase [Rhodospirillales bacterium]|nr:peptidylprolyl isomerase [Rhodospirillales bacterium]
MPRLIRPALAPVRATAAAPALGLAALLLASVPMPAAAQAPAAHVPLVDRLSPSQAAAIVATVNGQAITLADVDNRRRLLAASVGLPMTPAILDRLTAPIERELIDETLREQEMRRRHIAVPEAAVRRAIASIEDRNHMPPGSLLQRLAAAGIEPSTLLNQLRAQIGWGLAVRQALGSRAIVSAADIADREAALRAEAGQTEYNVGEIFLPAQGARQQRQAAGVADLIIQQLRLGAPFPLIAVQFSQSQSALAGGNLGWVQANQLDPEVLRVVKEMPPGAISNPIHVPGGEVIVTLNATRVIGAPPAPPGSGAAVAPVPGPVPAVAPAMDSRRAIEEQILAQRFELASRQMIRDLERRAVIDRRF